MQSGGAGTYGKAGIWEETDVVKQKILCLHLQKCNLNGTQNVRKHQILSKVLRKVDDFKVLV